MDIIAVIPTFNEENVIASTVGAIKTLPDVHDVIVVDDGSVDKTAEEAMIAGARVISCKKNFGKGQSLNRTFSQLNLDNCRGVILADGDLGASAVEFKHLIKAFKEEAADLIIAGFGKPSKKGGFGLVKGLSRWAINRYGGEFMQTPLSGQRLIAAGVLRDISPFASGFGLETDMTIKALKSGYKVKEIKTNMKHSETGRDLAGFTHRGRQFVDVLKVVLKNMVNR